MRINGKTKVIGIIGYPIEHTFSPIMHNTLFERLKLNYVYVPFLVKPEHLQAAVESIRALNIVGVNVTIPHKEKVIPYLDDIEPIAKKIGAVNTICNNKGKLIGYNTDVYGFISSIKAHNISVRKKRVFVLGAGGAAHAICFGLIEMGATCFYIADIFYDKAKSLCERILSFYPDVEVHPGPAKEEFTSYVEEVDIFVNASPVGMRAGDPLPVAKKSLCSNKNLFIYDVIYNRETELIKFAKERKIPYIDGLEMFVIQGARSFELWLKKKSVKKIMFEVVNKLLTSGCLERHRRAALQRKKR